MANKVALYRPYFTGKEILLISNLLEKETAKIESPEVWALHKKLRMIRFKIGNEMMQAAVVRNETTEESLGLVKDSNVKPESELRDRLNTLAEKYMNDPSSLSKEEIEEGKRLELIEYKMDMGMFPSIE